MIAAAARGDGGSFNQLVRVYQGIVYRTAFHLLGDTGAATMATQATFVAARKQLRSPGSLRGIPFKVWLLRHVLAACRAPGASGAHKTSRELGALLQVSLLTLPVPERAAVILADLVGLTNAELAQAMGKNVETVEACLGRARLLLRDALFAEPAVQSLYRRSTAHGVPAAKDESSL